MAEQKSSSALMAPLRGAASALRRVPGATMVSRAAAETLDKVGAVSPRGRRIAVYAGAGVLGAAGVVEWPVALTGAAVAWLTQPRPVHPADGENAAAQSPEPAHDLGTAALRSGHDSGSGGADGSGGATGAGASGGAETSAGGRKPRSSRPSAGARTAAGTRASGSRTSGGTRTARSSRTSGGSRSSRGISASGTARTKRGTEGSAGQVSTGPLGPTARPDRTTL
ncbi:hypothetical protein [Streptomyces roseochromogenus]|uniref:Uncharacterized protein n=1 Tax=Streptomyces roseochromogenus subsp. oscitans DS 12.976 TaxID=1352936 RepID=V6JL39_STRRC|nr:hypothetical protein [Streptomyces roseochromogenus]EST20438.1 hypothetical protein M878_39575 [Streptomyces roseochromogenus subsp. oscitans DS 12.976]